MKEAYALHALSIARLWTYSLRKVFQPVCYLPPFCPMHYFKLWLLFLLLPGMCSHAQVPADSLFARAKNSLQKGEYTAAMQQFRLSLQQAEQQKDGVKAGNALIGIGIAYERTANYEQALRHYFKALKYYEEGRHTKKEAGTLKNIGNTYRTVKTYDKSKFFLQKALTSFKALKDSAGSANVLNDLGILYLDQDSSRLATFYFREVIYRYSRFANDEVKAYALNNMAIAGSKSGDYENALTYYHEALDLMQRLQNQYGTALVLVNLGDLFLKWKQYKKSLQYSHKGLQMAEEIQSKSLQLAACKNMAQANHALDNHKQAYFYLEKQMRINDSVFKEETAKSYAEMESKYENEKKQQEIALLQKDNALKAQRIVNEQRRILWLFIVLFLLFVIAVALYRFYLLKKRSHTALTRLNEKLQEANASKTKLLSILSHDLRSPISSLFSFLQLKKSKQALLTEEQQEVYDKRIIQSAEDLLEAMEDLLVWSKSQMDAFSPVMETINLSLFLDEVMRLNASAASQKNIELVKQCPSHLEVQTDPNFLKIIFRNLLSNAIRFSPEGGLIQLKATCDNGNLNIVVEDNGPGIAAVDLPVLFEWNSIRSSASGLGLKLVKEFTEKLNGVITVQSGQGRGTAFLLSFQLS